MKIKFCYCYLEEINRIIIGNFNKSTRNTIQNKDMSPCSYKIEYNASKGVVDNCVFSSLTKVTWVCACVRICPLACLAGITSKHSNVPLDPKKSCLLVQDPIISRS